MQVSIDLITLSFLCTGRGASHFAGGSSMAWFSQNQIFSTNMKFSRWPVFVFVWRWVIASSLRKMALPLVVSNWRKFVLRNNEILGNVRVCSANKHVRLKISPFGSCTWPTSDFVIKTNDCSCHFVNWENQLINVWKRTSNNSCSKER
jgi:hypothetical protein